MRSSVKVTTYLVKVGDGSRARFTDKSAAKRFASRCGSAKVLTVPPQR